jgi:hypothetical protein
VLLAPRGWRTSTTKGKAIVKTALRDRLTYRFRLHVALKLSTALFDVDG